MPKISTFFFGFVLLLLLVSDWVPASAQAKRRRRDMSPWELAYEDFMARYPGAQLYGAPQGADRVVILFRGDLGPSYAVFDEKGRWEGTATLLEHIKLPVGPLKLESKLDHTFSWYLKVELAAQRPVFLLLDEASDWLAFPDLLTEEGAPQGHVFAAVAPQGDTWESKLYLVQGDRVADVPEAQRAWAGVGLTADGQPCEARDLADMATKGLMVFPTPLAFPTWTPPLSWRAGNGCYPLPYWVPDPAWRAGEEPGSLPFVSDDAMR
ncbi:MAG: hypothetical protein D6722_03085 [Bacteroidetes bacterium]|nr:MAG: hypothetical protein D6722_03085 [Bacteroidota bacterium]